MRCSELELVYRIHIMFIFRRFQVFHASVCYSPKSINANSRFIEYAIKRICEMNNYNNLYELSNELALTDLNKLSDCLMTSLNEFYWRFP